MPHYLGGKLGRSSSLGPSFPPSTLLPERYPAPPPPLSRSPHLDFAGEKKSECAIRSLPLSFSHSLFPVFTHTLLLVLHTVYLRIGSLSTRDPPLSLFLTDRSSSSAPLSHPLPRRYYPLGHTATPILRFLRTERACDNLLGRSSRTKTLVRPVLARWLLSLPPPPPFRSFLFRMLSHQPLDRPRLFGFSPYPAPRFLLPFLLVLIPYSCVIYAGSG